MQQAQSGSQQRASLTRSRLRRIAGDLTGREWGRLVSMFAFILAVNAAGWGIYLLRVIPHHFDYQGEGGSRGLGVGLGVAIAAPLQGRGLMFRFFGRFMKSINHTWQLYFVGLVFGIGFDTATEVVLLSATAYAAIQGLPYYAVLALPLLFSGGLTLFDTLDGCFMNFAYGWAFAQPVRKVYYNLVITGLSIGAAFIIGTIEILGILTTEVHLHGAFWSLMANFDINVAGFCIAALFVAVWAAALAYWHWGKVEARWTASVLARPAEVPEP